MLIKVVRATGMAVGGLFFMLASGASPASAASSVPLTVCGPTVPIATQSPQASQSPASGQAASSSPAPTSTPTSPAPSPASTTPSPVSTTPLNVVPTSSTTSPSPSGSTSITAPASPSPPRSPSPTVTPSPSPSGSGSSSPGVLCVQAQLKASATVLQPGGTAAYTIWVWSTVAVPNATATASITGLAVGAPTFTLCPKANLTTCTIGNMPAKQAFEMLIKAPIGTTAATGEQVTLTLTIQGGGLSPGVAAIAFLVGQSTLTPVPTNQGTPLSPIAFPTISSSTVAPSNLSGLFPVITPSSGPGSSPAASSSGHKVVNATSVASTLPLDPRLIGGQLAGLAVLAAALTMVVARLSLRTPVPVLRAGPATTSSAGDTKAASETSAPADALATAEAIGPSEATRVLETDGLGGTAESGLA